VKRIGGAVVLAWALVACPAGAQGKFSNPALAPAAPPPVVREADLEEQIGRRLDPSLAFTDEEGRRVRLGDYLSGDAPVVLVLAYYRCPMLCGLVLHGVVEGMKHLSLEWGREYRALTVSFDPRDTPTRALEKRASVLSGLGRPARDERSWPFLVGEEREARALASAVGFRYAYDARTDQYAHPAAAIVLTPDGRVSRYLYGVAFSPRDLRLSLVEAGAGRTGSIVDRLVLTCYRYDPAARAYGPFVVGFMRIGGALILVTISALLFALFRGERRRAAASRGARP
jgi:protein SCO1/2